MKRLILSLLLIMSGQAVAETSVYRSVDAEGNPVFSDKPTADSEAIELKEIQTVPAEKNLKFESRPSKQMNPERYTSLEITSPANGDDIRENAGNVTVEVEVKPKLRQADRLQLSFDSEIVQEGNQTTFEITEIDRGTHQISVAIIDRNGNEVKRSSSISFHLQRTSNLDPAFAPNPNVVSPTNPPKPPAPPVSPLNPPKPPPP